MEGGMLWRNGCDGKVLRCGAGNRHQQLGCNGDVTAVAVGQSQRLYSGVRMFTGNYLSSTPRALRFPGVYLELRPLIYFTDIPQWTPQVSVRV